MLSVLAISSLVAGLLVLVIQLGPQLLQQPPDVVTASGFALIAVGAGSSIMVLALWRRGCLSVAACARRLATEKKIEFIVSPDDVLAPLVGGVNDCLQMAERAVEEATLAVRELEIQLKVATAGRRHAEAIIHSISDPILVTDSFDELLLSNREASRVFGFDLEAANRVALSQLVKDTAMVGMIQEMRASGQSTSRTLEHRVRVGRDEERVYKVTLSNVNQQSGDAGGVVAVLSDLTREREIGAMKNAFISGVSHELRTPLSSIKAYVEMLMDGEADDEQTRAEFVEIINTEATRLERLIDNILDISRIESGLMKVDRRPMSLLEVAKEAVEVIRPHASGKNIEINERLIPAVHQTLGDRDMLYQAVLNLLSNAVKYTPEGGRVVLDTNVDEERKVLTGTITDTGVGIPAKDLPFVFDTFYRVEANNKMAKGTGLGLPMVRQIIEKVHGGRVWAESEPGKGSRFMFELPMCA